MRRSRRGARPPLDKSIKRGKLADLIAVRGDPLTNVKLLEDVRFVMKQGEIYKQD